MKRPVFLDQLMEHQQKVVEQKYECWSCGSHEPASRIVTKVWRDRQNGEEMNKLICFQCIETGVWLK